MILDVQISKDRHAAPQWRFNTLLLSDKEFCVFISNTIDEFLSFNQKDSISYSLLWETLKCYLREINAIFKKFYTALYKSESLADKTKLNTFFHDLPNPVIDVDTVKQLEIPLSLLEVSNAIKAMQSRKAPGPDGFPMEFYKTFIHKLAPLLLSVYNDSYRPISLLNADVKVLAKAIASRLENVLPHIISDEQNGFIKGRQLFFNTRTLFNVIYSKQVAELPELVISLDAEKAFDRVEWEYLFMELKKFGLGPKLISRIQLLYLLLHGSPPYRGGEVCAKTRVWEEFGEALESDFKSAPKRFWQTVRRLRRGKQCATSTVYSGDGVLLTSTEDVIGRWKEYFEDLLNPTDTFSSEEAESGDTGIGLSITEAEVAKVVKKLLGGRAAGVDEIRPEFLKALDVVGLSWLTRLFNIAWTSGVVPLDWQTGVVVPLFKKGDRRVCSNYRGITLLSLPGKVYARVLEKRVRLIVEPQIQEEQCGFRPGRGTLDQLFTLSRILEGSWEFAQPVHMCFVDLEKAFDCVPRGILWEVLREYGVHGSLLRAIQALYKQTSVHTNDTHSEFFPLGRGARQGCPLSPLLFAIAIEPLSIALRSCPLIKGIIRNGIEYKVSLYADDLLLYITDPDRTLPAVLSILEDFGSFSGYKLNLGKSECFPVNATACDLQQSDLPFQFSPSGFKYLGVNVTRTLAGLSSANFTPLVRKVTSDFQRWGNLPLSLIGKINVVKMAILPKFLFRLIPLFLPAHFFNSLDSIIGSFIWGGKPPRVSKTLLQRCRLSGGLALPNLRFYYWATHIHNLCYLLDSPQYIWSKMELASCKRTSLPALLFSSLPARPSLYTDNPVLLNTLKIWYQFRRYFKFTTASLSLPVKNNKLFPSSLTDPIFTVWFDKGITQFRHLYADGVFSNFINLSAQFDLPSSHLFRYFQARNFASKSFLNFPDLPEKQCWEHMLSDSPHHRGSISRIYNIILASGKYSSTKFKSEWETELGIRIAESSWDQAMERIRSTTSCARLGLIQFKVVHRVHFSKTRLASIYPEVEDRCDRCHGSPCHLSHMFYLCPYLKNFWTQYFSIISTVLGVNLQPCPLISIFGISDPSLTLSSTQKDVIAFTSLLARRSLLLQWKSSKCPPISRWLMDVMSFLKLEKIKYTIRGCTAKFFNKWQPFISYFNELETLPN
uniref:Reverse transcriptase domain-containing protein n=1 Tax=Pygocentrus nattereri TaxID=42514 RepID=A0AAR2JQE7_PYGNA